MRCPGSQCIHAIVEAGVKGTWQGLAAGNESPSSPPAITVIFFVVQLRLILDECFDNLLDVANFNEDILGL